LAEFNFGLYHVGLCNYERREFSFHWEGGALREFSYKLTLKPFKNTFADHRLRSGYVQVKLSLYLVHEDVLGSGGVAAPFLTSTLEERE
jgi:hypothetical protein